MTRVAFFAAWVALVALGFGPLAPAEPRPDQTEWLIRLLTGDWAGENPAVVAEFCLMGLWPPLLALLLRDRWRERPVPAWPFLLASVGLGCYALLPWFFLARPGSPPRPPGLLGRLAGAALALTSAGFLAWGLLAGDLPAFWQGVQTDPFLWAMTLDFAAFWALSITLAPGHLAGALPLVGPGLQATLGR